MSLQPAAVPSGRYSATPLKGLAARVVRESAEFHSKVLSLCAVVAALVAALVSRRPRGDAVGLFLLLTLLLLFLCAVETARQARGVQLL